MELSDVCFDLDSTHVPLDSLSRYSTIARHWFCLVTGNRFVGTTCTQRVRVAQNVAVVTTGFNE